MALQLTRIGAYQVGRTLGEGVSGVVKEAKHVETGQQVALKIIHTGKMTDKQKERLQREMTIMKILDHPSVVKLYEIIDLPEFESTCLVIEFVNGYDLFEVVIQRGQLSERESARYMREIVEALEYCHGQLVMHRDLKLENVLLTKQGKIKVTDFGISNFMKPGILLDTYCGSPFYWSPEMIQRVQYIGPEVDMWSLGVCLYCMVTGLFPWEGSTSKDQLQNAVQGKYEAPVFLSDDCKDLLKRLLDPNAKTRCTLPELKLHPWLNDGLRIPPPKARQIEHLDQDIITKLKGFGLPVEEMKYDILHHQTSPAYVLYDMILEYREREEKKKTDLLSTKPQESLSNSSSSTPIATKDDANDVLNSKSSPSGKTNKGKSKNIFKNIFGKKAEEIEPVNRTRSSSL